MDSTSKNSVGDASETKRWYGRKCKLLKLGSTEEKEEALFAELKHTAELLKDNDAQNKYAWSHRQWVLENLGRGYADELGFCEYLNFDGINTYNRLMWDQRCFAVQKCLAKGMSIIRSCEIRVAATDIKWNPEDENPWRYLRFLFKNDMKALAQSYRLRLVLKSIFVQARDSAYAVRADIKMYTHNKHAWLFDSVNKRACLFALDLLSDLLKCDYQLDKVSEAAFEYVFKEYDGNTIADKVKSVLGKHRMELMELRADFTKMINRFTGKMETAGFTAGHTISCEDNGSFFPRSELCDKTGFSQAVFIRDDDPYWLANMRKCESKKERRGPTLEVTKDDHQDIYSDLPESLRNGWKEMCKYSTSEIIKHTNELLFFTGYADPTVWQLRRLAIHEHVAIHEHGRRLEVEMELLEKLGDIISLDNYLYWHQRRWVSEYIGSNAAANSELKFTKKVITNKPNNHYAWSHRQWVRKVFSGKDWGRYELDFCNEILKKDAYNGLAWNQRYFVVQQHPKRHGMRGSEVKYATAAIQKKTENEMPWMYLQCLASDENYEFLSTLVLSKVVRHIKEGKAYICEAYVKKRVVNALKMVLFAADERSDFKPIHELNENIDYLCRLCRLEAAEKSFGEKVFAILCSMDVTYVR
ncbi:hypothetical protein CASFOL_041130 [Castilleja foliolosa]|uniref:Protein farnesyltransferase/geranylgeranyltransferase type-1 subunit alpha n=1 Tax=Castilleja foliolosa TaxID=1961234 RepID=A0ABD3BE68_9LAMI